MNVDRWLTTTPEDRAHKDECNCLGCHEGHKQSDMVRENALERPQDFGCCVEEADNLKVCC